MQNMQVWQFPRTKAWDTVRFSKNCEWSDVVMKEKERKQDGTPVDNRTNLNTKDFEAVALAHRDSIYRYALHMSKSKADAEDLVQDTYLKAYRFFDKFEAGTNCKAWLLTILKNTFLNTVRRNKGYHQMIHLSEMEERGVQLLTEDGPEDEVFGDLLDDDITAAMEELPAGYRTAVVLADMEGLSYREVADRMSCPVGTVMSRLHRGRRLLRERLRDYVIQYGYAVGQE